MSIDDRSPSQVDSNVVEIATQHDNEDQLAKEHFLLFDNKSLQNAFVRKVFFILCCQLLLTCATIAPLLYSESVNTTMKSDRSILLMIILLFGCLYTILICNYEITRPTCNYTWPQNYIILFFLTVSMGVIIGCICVQYDFKEILIAVGLMGILCLCMAVFPDLPIFDFPPALVVISFSLTVLLNVLIPLSFIIRMPAETLMWTILIASVILLCIYFISDVLIVLRGEHRHVVTPKDHIAAVTLLYVDILYFLVFTSFFLIFFLIFLLLVLIDTFVAMLVWRRVPITWHRSPVRNLKPRLADRGRSES